MKISFKDDHTIESFRDIAEQLKTRVCDNRIITTDKIGQGSLFRLPLENGCCIQTWEINFNEDIQLSILPSLSAVESYSFCFFLQPAKMNFLVRGEHLVDTDTSHILYVLCNSSSVDPFLKSGTTGKYLSIRLPVDAIPKQLQSLLYRDVCLSSTKFHTYTIGEDIINSCYQVYHATMQRLPLLEIKTATFGLMEKLVTVFSMPGKLTGPYNSTGKQTSLAIERKILLGLEKGIPLLSELAAEFEISESTLKRHFKLNYGKSIYDFYLDRKMEYARGLIEREHLNVSETAARLGYEKASHFIEMFRKHTGESPGKIKKN